MATTGIPVVTVPIADPRGIVSVPWYLYFNTLGGTTTGSSGGSGTVSSVNIAGSNGLTVSGSPITTAGTITLAIPSLSTGQITATGLTTSTVSAARLSLIASVTGVVGVTVSSTTSTWLMTLPTTTGTVSQVLQTDGAGATSWASISVSGGTGTVLSVNVAGTNGITVTGSGYTITGTVSLSLPTISTGQITAAALAALGTVTALGVSVTNTLTATSIVSTNLSAATVTASTVSAVTVTATNVIATNVSAGTVTASTVSAVTVTATKVAATNVSAGTVTASTISAVNVTATNIVATTVSAGTITAANISVTSLTAINVSVVGTVTAATVSSVAIQAGSSGIISGQTVSAGIVASVTGRVALFGGVSQAVTVQAAATAGNWTMTLPSNAGTVSQVLQTDGAGITSWSTVSSSGGSGGGWVKIGNTQTVTAATAQIDFTAAGGYTIDSTYNEYVVVIVNALPATNATVLQMQVFQGGTIQTGAGYADNSAGAQTSLPLNGGTSGINGVDSTAGYGGASLEVVVSNPASTTIRKKIAVRNLIYLDAATGFFNSNGGLGGAYTTNTTAVDGFRFKYSSGNIAACDSATLFGIQK